MSKLIGCRVRVKKTGAEGVITGYNSATREYEVKLNNEQRAYVKRGQFEKVDVPAKKPVKSETTTLPKLKDVFPRNSVNLSASQTKRLLKYLKEETDKKDDAVINLQIQDQKITIQRNVLLKILQKLVRSTTAISLRVERQKVALVRERWSNQGRIPHHDYKEMKEALGFTTVENILNEDVLVIYYITEGGTKGHINILSDTFAKAETSVTVEKVVA